VTLVRLWRGVHFGLLALATLVSPLTSHASVEGDLQTWHRVEIRFAGPRHAESDSNPHPFLDYRLQCRFEGPSGQVYDVPGFFDASGGSNPGGTLWICRFAPDEAGPWSYLASFRTGPDVAVSLDPQAGTSTSFDGETGSFDVAPSDKSGRDFRSPLRGRLVNVGDRYLTFLGSGDRWIKGGPNIPENFLGYTGFVRTPRAKHTFDAHRGDWRPGDPDWGGGKGRAIIGALNYIADTGGNSIYFLPMNLGGDGRDSYPTISEQDKTHFDTEKLRQWEVVFGHATARGILLHFQLNETESANENYHDGGELGVQRKLYYRELVARFAHHPGVQWNLGEENDFGSVRHGAFAARLKALDPYDHPVTTHTRTNQQEQYYKPLLGNGDFDMTSFQISLPGLEDGDAVWEWVGRSARSGTPWVVSVDEPQRIDNDPTEGSLGYSRGRRFFLWPVYLSGGGGFEWYVQDTGGGHGLDQRLDNFREMEVALQWTGYALDFMHELPFWLMEPQPALGSSSGGGKTFVLARPGDSYALYNAMGGSLTLDLSNDHGTYSLRWFNPQSGRWFAGGSVAAGAPANLGAAPFGGDAAAVLVREGQDSSAPVASFTMTPSRGEPPLSVRLDASSSVADGSIAHYQWNFGDGATSVGAVAEHTYASAGGYTVTLTVVDDVGAKGSASQKVRVLEAAPVPPPTLPDVDPTPNPPANSDPAEGPAPPTQAGPYRLVVSQSPRRTGATPLANAELTDEVYIFVTPGTGVRKAHFSLDGKARQTERVAPHDFAGGSVTHANAFDTRSVSNGTHRIRAVLEFESGEQAVVEEKWVAVNSVAGEPTPMVTDPIPSSSPDYQLVVSQAPDRAGALPLAGATLEGEVYIFVSPGHGIRQARFYLDGMKGQLERQAPHDFAGGSAAIANPFNTRGTQDGTHRVKAELELENGRSVVIEERWSAANRASPATATRNTDDTQSADDPFVAGEFRLMVSRSPQRTGAVPLAGAMLADEVYIFVSPGRGIRQARFYLNGMKGQLEREAPHDFAGGSAEIARPFDTRTIRDGIHRIKAELELENGRTAVVEESWIAANRVSSAPTARGLALGGPDADAFRLMVSHCGDSAVRPLSSAAHSDGNRWAHGPSCSYANPARSKVVSASGLAIN